MKKANGQVFVAKDSVFIPYSSMKSKFYSSKTDLRS